MPQMAPIWWTFIMLMSTSLLFFTLIMIYFYGFKKLTSSIKTEHLSMIWKW